MTYATDHELIDQAFFGWSETTSRLDLVACSLGPSQGKQWAARLKPLIRLQNDGRSPTPDHALSYLVFGQEAVILRRVREGHSSGRNNSHALIGPLELLTFTDAVKLDNWTGWRSQSPENETLPPLSYSHLIHNVIDRAPILTEHDEYLVSTVLARLLEYPYKSFSVIGVPTELRIPFMCVLHGAGSDYLRRAGSTMRWSFSTHEIRHADSIDNLPQIVFLPDLPADGAVADRVIVDLRPGHSQPSLPFIKPALDLMSVFLRGSSATVQDRRQIVHNGPSESAQSTGPSQGNSGFSSQAMGSAHAGPTPSPRPSPKSVDSPGMTRGVELSRWAEVAGALADARTLTEFKHALANAGKTATSQQWRRELRVALDTDKLNRIAEFITRVAPQELTHKILPVFYGPNLEDLKESAAMEHATAVIKNCRSPQLAAMVADAAWPHGQHNVAVAAFNRWTVDPQQSVFVPPNVSRASRSRTPLSARLQAWVRRMAPVLGATFLIGCVLGIVFGVLLAKSSDEPEHAGSSGTQLAPTASQPVNAPNSASPIPRANSLPVVGRAVLTPLPRHEVLSFVQVGKKYYPQALCFSGETNDWVCTRQRIPPDEKGAQPALVAVSVPANQIFGLLAASAKGESIPRLEGWSDPVPVEIR